MAHFSISSGSWLAYPLISFCPAFLAVDLRPRAVLLTSCLSLYFTQGLLVILQFQVFAGFPIELVYAPAFLLLELVLE